MKKYRNEQDLYKHLKNFFFKNGLQKNKKIFFSLSGTYAPWQIFHVIVLTKAMNKLGYKVDYFLGNNQKEMEEILKFNDGVIYKIDRMKLFIRFFFKIAAYNVFFLKYYHNIEKVFNLHVGGVYIGDVIYDEYLRLHNKPTVSKITLRYIFVINKALLFYFYYDHFFKNNTYNYVFNSHAWYVRFGILGRVATKYKISVINYKSGAESNTGFSLSKMSTGVNPKHSFWVDTELSNFYKDDKHVLGEASDYFTKIIKNPEQHKDYNFHIAKTTTDEKNLLGIKSLITGHKKVIVISAHVFLDNVTGLNGHDQIYRDYYTWFKETLKLCEKNDKIISFVKVHPMEGHYNYFPKILDLYEELNLKNVHIWPNNVDLKDNNNLIDVVLTVNGSVSVELPCFGIPVVCASRSSAVTGYDTIIEPKDKSEYEDLISNIHNIKKLEKNKVILAKLLFFIYNKNMWYTLDSRHYPAAVDTIKDKFLPHGYHILPTPVREDFIEVIIKKLELFDNEFGEQYTNDLQCFFKDGDVRTLSQVALLR